MPSKYAWVYRREEANTDVPPIVEHVEGDGQAVGSFGRDVRAVRIDDETLKIVHGLGSLVREYFPEPDDVPQSVVEAMRFLVLPQLIWSDLNADRALAQGYWRQDESCGP